jgi:hypothetical protein
MKRVFRYLNSTKEFGIRIRPSKDYSIKTYVDASFAPHKDAKSHTGAADVFGEGVINVASLKQGIVTRSTPESELVAASDRASNSIWLKFFMKEQGYEIPPITIYQDNKSTIAMIEKGKDASSKARHINIKYFFVKEKVEEGLIKFEYIPTREMLADLFTKPIQGSQFIYLRNKLMNWKT